MITEDAQWELGFEKFDPGLETEFGFENRDDLDAINAYVVGLPQRADALQVAGKVSKSKYDKFQQLYQDWKGFYQYVTSSWYVSDSDLAAAKKRRDDMNMLLMPEATKWVQKYSTKPTGKAAVKATREGGYESETKTWLQRNWLWVVGGVVVLGSATYLAGSGMAVLKAAKRATLARAIAH